MRDSTDGNSTADSTHDTWAELNIQDDGIGVTLYTESEDNEDGHPVVLDETWYTDDELEAKCADPEADTTVVING